MGIMPVVPRNCWIPTEVGSMPSDLNTPDSTTELPDPVAEIRQGTVLDQFRIVRLLGRGGMGAVYEAEDTLLLRPVAIKVLSLQVRGDGPAPPQLLREAQAVARLDHPHIVRIYHVDRWANGYYLVL